MENNNKPVRRVGTFTMGLYLIIAGIVAVIATFNHNIDFMLLLKLTPIVFVLLGLEVLVYHFTLKSEKIKYDIFSIFICFVLIGATLCTAAVPWVLSFWGPEREMKEEQMQSELYDKCYAILKDNKDILNMKTNTSFGYHLPDYTALELKDATQANLRITFIPTINTKETFAKSCKTILDSLANTDIRLTGVRFNAQDLNMSLELNDKFSKNLTEAMIETMIDTED